MGIISMKIKQVQLCAIIFGCLTWQSSSCWWPNRYSIPQALNITSYVRSLVACIGPLLKTIQRTNRIRGSRLSVILSLLIQKTWSHYNNYHQLQRTVQNLKEINTRLKNQKALPPQELQGTSPTTPADKTTGKDKNPRNPEQPTDANPTLLTQIEQFKDAARQRTLQAIEEKIEQARSEKAQIIQAEHHDVPEGLKELVSQGLRLKPTWALLQERLVSCELSRLEGIRSEQFNALTN